MRKSMYVVLALVAGLFVWSFASQTTATASGFKDVPPGFGNKVAGCYYVDAVHPDGYHIVLTMTLSAEGGITWTGTGMFGSPDPAHDTFIGPAHGTWIKTGPRSIEAAVLGLIFDKDGTYLYSFRESVPIEFANDFQTGSSEYHGLLYLPEQDPLDPNEVPIAEWDGIMTMRRLTVW